MRHLPFKRHSSYSRLQDDPQMLNARKTVQGACNRYGQGSTEHTVSLINLDEVYTRCAEEFAQNTIDDIEKHTLECRSAEAWKAINLFLWQKIQIYELRECRVDRLHEAKYERPLCRYIKSSTQ